MPAKASQATRPAAAGLLVRIVEMTGTDTIDLWSPEQGWWSVHTEPGWGIEFEPGQKLAIGIGALSLCFPDGAVMRLTGPTTLDIGDRSTETSVWQYMHGIVYYVSTSKPVQTWQSWEYSKAAGFLSAVLGPAGGAIFSKLTSNHAPSGPVISPGDPHGAAQAAGQAQPAR